MMKRNWREWWSIAELKERDFLQEASSAADGGIAQRTYSAMY
jgi:hypothetical protein